jgi:alanyl-tRNA synthetase
VYDSIRTGAQKVRDELTKEEEKFTRTLEQGTREFEKIVRGMREAAQKTGQTITHIS